MLRLDRRSLLQLAGLAAISSAGAARLTALRFLNAATTTSTGPLRLDSRNPHYFFYQGKPLVLVGSGEHYGSVLNTDFNYSRYLETIAEDGLNHTRLFSGVYHEVPGDFGIVKNTLGPDAKHFLCPWVRSSTPGALDGLNKFDLSRWNDEYFARLADFMRTAEKNNVIIEMNLFCPFYQDRMWDVSPFNSKNNINGIGDMKRTDVYTLKDSRMQALQDEIAKRIIVALRKFDNFYFEICNEPYFAGVTLEWQKHIARLIVDTEASSPNGHLISQNIGNGSVRVVDPDPLVSIFTFHYSRPPESVAMNYALNKAIGINETGFDGTTDAPYRIEAWDFLIAGGALYSNLDYSFVAGYEDGTFTDKHAGGGGPTLRQQLAILRRFMSRYDLPRMTPSSEVVKSVAPSGPSVRALGELGKAYAIYLHHGRVLGGVKVDRVGYSVDSAPHQEQLTVDLPANSYTAEWTNPKTGKIDKTERFKHSGGQKTLASPQYTEDTALRIAAG